VVLWRYRAVMGEQEKTEGAKVKVSRLAVAGVLCAVLVVLLLVFVAMIVYPLSLQDAIFAVAGIVALIGVLLCAAALARIRKVQRRLLTILLCLPALIVNVPITGVWVTGGLARRCSVAFRMVCGSYLAGLGKAMVSYANDHDGQYPDPNRWCDALLGYDVTLRQFICPGSPKLTLKWPPWDGRRYSWPKALGYEGKMSSYAMNPNCRSVNDQGDMVLLFESEVGWNRSGGHETATCEHHEGQGLSILFNNGGCRFERCIAIDKLNWSGKGEEQNDE